MNAMNNTDPPIPPNDDPVIGKELYRYRRYKPNSPQRKRGIIGRWQRWNGYGWDNVPAPESWEPAIDTEGLP